MDADNLHSRLNKIMGQIRAIDKMLDDDVRCEEILIQVNAAKSALHKVGQRLLEDRIDRGVREGIKDGDAEKAVAGFARAIEYFSRIS
ncbi:DNA-binding transcriptional regulator, FrmR family [Sporobacter termitidis DSM 10068]|uniref:DNA-binding transcriptional regulator, FrmR family n=1 Tax=Sporobacter termitidis DSM 10068 TaxID=1123282 RepID=A0A1M5XGD3_9FIRM|nr:metal-sensing transcriptional repressor [Sporobacter termitidis]SHH98846.1 DNA-binding transcriptional regulator, FrmR family [Sporobacter termitidis DSM 10068]